MTQYIAQYTLLSTHLHLQILITLSHWSGLRPLASATLSILDPHGDFSQISCSVSWRSCGFGSAVPATPGALVVLILVDVGVGLGSS